MKVFRQSVKLPSFFQTNKKLVSNGKKKEERQVKILSRNLDRKSHIGDERIALFAATSRVLSQNSSLIL